MLVTKIISKVCKETRGAKRVDASSLRVGHCTIRVYDNGGLYDVTSLGRDFSEPPRTKRNVFATDLDDTIRSFIKGVQYDEFCIHGSPDGRDYPNQPNRSCGYQSQHEGD